MLSKNSAFFLSQRNSPRLILAFGICVLVLSDEVVPYIVTSPLRNTYPRSGSPDTVFMNMYKVILNTHARS